VKQITSRRQDSQVKAERLKEGALKYKLQHLDNDAIAHKLFDEGIGVEEQGELVRPYSAKYISGVIREGLRDVAAERGNYGKEMQSVLEAELVELIDFWREKATDPDAPSLKAADLVRKITMDRATLIGANAPVEQIISVRVDSALSNFVDTLRQLMPEEHFDHVIAAITQAEKLSSEYWAEQRQLKASDDDVIDADIVG
jgi:hypothetical protein